MILITSDTDLRKYIPNVLRTVEGEPSLFDKLAPFLETSEQWLIQSFINDEILNALINNTSTTLPHKVLLRKIVASDAFLSAVPSLDLVLTPNGFGIVSNQNIAPASKDRVDRLLASLEAERDRAIELLLPRLPLLRGWQQSEHGLYFAATLFPNLSLCLRLAIKQHLWAEYQALRERLIKIEDKLANTYFSQEQMTVFREKSMALLTNCHPLMLQVIRSLQSLELQILTAENSNPQATDNNSFLPFGGVRGGLPFFDLVNTIREHPDLFPQWHASATAELFTPKVFENKKLSGGFWL